MKKNKLLNWLPALVMMSVIFLFSSQPLENLPYFDWADMIIKKGGHMLGYGLLVLTYWYALSWAGRKWWIAWLLAIFYAFTDEYHQSFVQGRHPSIWDVFIFDNFGALIALWLANGYLNKRSDENSDRF